MTLRFTVASAALLTLAGCSHESHSCFAGSTLVATPRGPRPIRDLAVGDEVWSYDAAERRFALGKVTAIHRARGAIRSVRTVAGVLAAVTDSHPIFVAEKNEFVAAGKLTTRDQLLHWNGDPESQPAACAVLGFSSPAPGDEVEVFNLTVGDAFSTFFADGFLVHNKDPIPTECTVLVPGTAVVGDRFCAGSRGVVTVRECPGDVDASTVVLATSDPDVVVFDGNVAIAVAPGRATVTALVDGEVVGRAAVTVSECGFDAAASDAPSDSDSSSDGDSDASSDGDSDASSDGDSDSSSDGDSDASPGD